MIPLLFFYTGDFGIEYPTKFDMALNRESKSKQYICVCVCVCVLEVVVRKKVVC